MVTVSARAYTKNSLQILLKEWSLRGSSRIGGWTGSRLEDVEP